MKHLILVHHPALALLWLLSTGPGGIFLLTTSCFEPTTLTRMCGVLLALIIIQICSGKLTLSTQWLVAPAVAKQMQIGKHKVAIVLDCFFNSSGTDGLVQNLYSM